MDSFILIAVFGVLALYFFSSATVYKSLYKKVNEEKNIVESKQAELEKLIERYDKQVKGSVRAMNQVQESLDVARDDLQEARIEIADLRHKNSALQSRNDELYAQVNAIM
jgi:septal ring factor EnvC (AmiA/AmiB activator)